jgi:hypothetical protein
MNTRDTVRTIASESLDTMRTSHECLRWLSALGRAIQDDLSTGKGHVAKDLAAVVQYLAEEHGRVQCADSASAPSRPKTTRC